MLRFCHDVATENGGSCIGYFRVTAGVAMALAQERYDNPGASLTNSAAQVYRTMREECRQIALNAGLNFDTFLFYQANCDDWLDPAEPVRIEEVRCTGLSSVSWNHLKSVRNKADLSDVCEELFNDLVPSE